jgi:hypothetical protein
LISGASLDAKTLEVELAAVALLVAVLVEPVGVVAKGVAVAPEDNVPDVLADVPFP